MPRWARSGQLDERQVPSGDQTFIGMDMKSQDPSAIKPGFYREGYNCRSENGGLAHRLGCLCPGALNAVTYGQIYGTGIFSNPNGLEWLAIAVVDGVWFARDGEYPRFVPLPEKNTEPVNFTQAFDILFIWRGSAKVPYLWRGDWSQFWETFPPPTGGRQTVPNAATAENAANRILVPYGKDRIAVSDIADYTLYDWVLDDFQINQGESDDLVRVFPWQQETVICFKRHSIYRVTGVSGDLSQATLSKLPGTLGLVGLRAVVEVSGDIYFMSQSGVFRISQILQDTPQPDDIPISDLIRPIINAINWNAASLIRAEYRRERIYFAIPLNNAVRNNCLIVYNIVTQSWESIDTWEDPDFRIDDLVKMDYIGERRLYAIDRIKGIIVLLEQGKTDLLGPSHAFEWNIDLAVMTRGYGGPENRNFFKRMEMDVATWAPRFSVKAYVDGDDGKLLIDAKTKDRTKYQVFGRPRWNPINTADDHAKARRQDYSVTLPLMLGYNGVEIERLQQSSERYDVNRLGRYVQYKIECSQGHMQIRQISHEDFGDQREPRTQT